MVVTKSPEQKSTVTPAEPEKNESVNEDIESMPIEQKSRMYAYAITKLVQGLAHLVDSSDISKIQKEAEKVDYHLLMIPQMKAQIPSLAHMSNDHMQEVLTLLKDSEVITAVQNGEDVAEMLLKKIQ